MPLLPVLQSKHAATTDSEWQISSYLSYTSQGHFALNDLEVPLLDLVYAVLAWFWVGACGNTVSSRTRPMPLLTTSSLSTEVLESALLAMAPSASKVDASPFRPRFHQGA